MKKWTTPKTAKEAAEKVREAIARSPSPEVTLEVVEERIRRRPEGWDVPVRPVRWPRYLYIYAGLLAEVEADLQDIHHLNVYLKTADPVEESVLVAAA